MVLPDRGRLTALGLGANVLTSVTGLGPPSRSFIGALSWADWTLLGEPFRSRPVLSEGAAEAGLGLLDKAADGPEASACERLVGLYCLAPVLGH